MTKVLTRKRMNNLDCVVYKYLPLQIRSLLCSINGGHVQDNGIIFKQYV